MCGEYAWIQFFSQSRKGSPPHAWRIPVFKLLGISCIGSPPHTWRIPTARKTCRPASGITSTYVENTVFHAASLSDNKDHLHIRGEYANPPQKCLFIDRITSTYVENTLIFLLFLNLLQDHLHIRGEYKLFDRLSPI